MTLANACSFFMWCTIFNLGIQLLWVLMLICAPDRLYQVQNLFFPMERSTYNTITYAFMGFYKLIILFFNIIPLLALMIVGSR